MFGGGHVAIEDLEVFGGDVNISFIHKKYEKSLKKSILLVVSLIAISITKRRTVVLLVKLTEE